MAAIDFFASATQSDVFRMLCADQIGEGAGREVFECAYDPTLVVKIETGSQSFQNIAEWQLWWDAQPVEHAKRWLAPCEAISPCGIVLIQKRTKTAKRYPDRVPVWMTDLKMSNFGLIGRQFVCHDYGTHLMCNSGLSKRLRKADWWGE